MTQGTIAVTTHGLTNFRFEIPESTEPVNQARDFLDQPRTVAISSSALQHERIAQDENILGGEPFIRGTRVPVAAILDGLAEGLTQRELIQHFPRLTRDDILAALEYSATRSLSPAE